MYRPLTADGYMKLSKAREYIRTRAPYYMPILYKLVPVQADLPPNAGMFVTQHLILGCDEELLASMPTPKLAWMLVHEACHVWLDHVTRGQTLGVKFGRPWERDAWLSAVDFSINPMLASSGWSVPTFQDLPESWLDRWKERPELSRVAVIFPSDVVDENKVRLLPDGLSAEEYYRRLMAQVVIVRQGEDETTEEAIARFEAENGEIDKNKKIWVITNSPGDGQCGSVTGDGAEGEVKPDYGRSDADVQNAVQAASQAAVDYARQGGNLPGDLKVWAEMALGTAKIPWSQRLPRLLKRAEAWVAGQVQPVYNRASKRQAAVGYGPGRPILPALGRPEFKIMFVVDSSASMSADEGGKVMTEAAGVMQSVNGSIEFGVCDAGMQGVSRVKSVKEAIQLLKGGGGTSFLPVFEYIASLPAKKRPKVVILGTDGGGQAPDLQPKGLFVIWLLVGAHKQLPYTSSGAPINWGEIIEAD